ncbi:MAG: hypothetical protein DRI61_00325 [Chloroflexi bacterium]|nr:MAG: hypothetical protein DRI61_00325 [Chloroflexota bacterium]
MTEVTVLVCTKNILQSKTLQCIAEAKSNTDIPFDLVVLETKEFSHPKDINKVLKVLQTKYFITLDDDVFLEDQWLEYLIEVIKDPSIGAVQVNLRDSEGRPLIWKGEGNIFSYPPKEVVDIGYACTAASIYKKSVIEEVGLMDENFKKWSFDTDYSWRIKEKGYRVVVSPKSKGIHLVSSTISKDRKNPIYEIKDRIYLIKKWFLTNRFREEYSDNNPNWINYWRNQVERS